ncbi:MAG: hypothetical protein LUG58_03765 [Clostridiales bacterium]|nr:hypothetical protein [Clostridiales bacterium]
MDWKAVKKTVKENFDNFVKEICELFTLEPNDGTRKMLLGAIITIATTTVMALNWVYLYVHYYKVYNVEVTYLSVDTPWLVNFVVSVVKVVIVGLLGLWFWKRREDKNSRPKRSLAWQVLYGSLKVLAVLGVVLVATIVGYICISVNAQFNKNYVTMVASSPPVSWVVIGVWYLLRALSSIRTLTTMLSLLGVSFILSMFLMMFLPGREASNKNENSRIKSYLCFVLYIALSLLILGLCLFWKQLKNIAGTTFHISNPLYSNLLLLILLIVLAVLYISISLRCIKISNQRRFGHKILSIFLVILSICIFFRCDDLSTRANAYAITEDGNYVIVYQSPDCYILKKCKIETTSVEGKNGQNSEIYTLTIYASQKSIVKNETISYREYLFDDVVLDNTISTRWIGNQASIDDGSTSDNAETSITANTSTDPADGAASYDTSN